MRAAAPVVDVDRDQIQDLIRAEDAVISLGRCGPYGRLERIQRDADRLRPHLTEGERERLDDMIATRRSALVADLLPAWQEWCGRVFDRLRGVVASAADDAG